MSFGRLRQRIELECVPHVQHDYFSTFSQSDRCFLASLLQLPSSWVKLPINVKAPRQRSDRAPGSTENNLGFPSCS